MNITKLEKAAAYTQQDICDIYKQILFDYSVPELTAMLDNKDTPSFLHAIISAYTNDMLRGSTATYAYMMNAVYSEPQRQNHLTIIINSLKSKPTSLSAIMRLTGEPKAYCLDLISQIAKENVILEAKPEEYTLIEGKQA
jgi:hypothetical protein